MSTARMAVFIPAAIGLALFAATPAHAGGSDAPTSYTVNETGITLPDGSLFPDNGHVNIHTSNGDTGLHFEGKCITRTDAECAGDRHAAAQFIGESFIPWSAFGLECPFSVSWVQLSAFNEHFGEGGQAAVEVACAPEPTPEPTVEPTPEPTVEPTVEPTTEPTVEPTIGDALYLAETGTDEDALAFAVGIAAGVIAGGLVLLIFSRRNHV